MKRFANSTQAYHTLVALAGLTLLAYNLWQDPFAFENLGLGLIAAAFITLLAAFPLVQILEQATLIPVLTLGVGLLLGAGTASWATAIGVSIGISVTGLRRAGPPPRDWLRGLFQESGYLVGAQLLPLSITFAVSGWTALGPYASQPLPPGDIATLALAFSLAHGLLLLVDLLLGGQATQPTFPHTLVQIGLLELLTIPFMLLAGSLYSATPVGALLALGGVPAILTLLLQGAGAARKDLERRLQDLSTLNTISQTLQSTLDMERLLSVIQQQVTRLLGVDNFYVALYEPSEQQLWYPLAVKNGQRRDWPRRPLTDRLTDRVIRERRPILLAQDAGQELARIGLPPSEDAPYAWLGVPLITSERTLGCLAVFSTSPEVAFTPADSDLLTTLSGQVSVAIENALLFDQAQRRASQLENLNRFSTLISASLDPQEVLAQVCRSATHVSGGQHSAIFLISPEAGEVRLAYGHGLSEAFVHANRVYPLDDDLRTRCLRTGRPSLTADINDLPAPPTFLASCQQEKVRAFGDFPLITPEGQIGFLAVYFTRPHTFHPEEVDLLQTFASQAALSLSNARLYARTDMALTRRAHQLTILENIGRELAAALRSERLFQMILDYALEFTNSPWGSLNLHDPATHSIEIKASRGYNTVRDRYPDTDGIAGRVIRTRQAVNIGDVTQAPDYMDLTGGAARSQLSVPLIHEDRVLGVLTVESPQPEAFTANDESFISQLATQAAIAVVNAGLYRETRRRLQEQARLYEFSKELVANLKLERVLDIVARAIAEVTQSLAAGVYLWDPAARTYHLRASSAGGADSAAHLPKQVEGMHIRASHAASLGTGLLHIPSEEGGSTPLLGTCGHCQALLMPLQIGDQPLGVILTHLPAEVQLERADLHLPRSIAAQGAIAIQNALLFADVSKGRDRLAAVLNSVDEGVLMVDAGGTVILANAGIQRLTGAPVDEILGCQLSMLPASVHRALGLTPRQAEHLVADLGLERRLPASKITLKGSSEQPERVLERVTAPVWGHGRDIIGWVFVLRDISEQYRLDQARDLITETLVHDLRSPMGAVSSALTLLDDTLEAEGQDPVVFQSLGIAHRSTQRVLALIESLLDISRMETGHIRLELSTFDLYTTSNELLQEFVPQANELGIVLRNDVEPTTPPIHADREKIARVIANLLDNALKFTPAGGQVTLSTEVLNDQVVAVKVEDTGPGIPLEYREKIFDRFTQVPGKPGRRRGSGVGLTFCRLAVEAHGGKIWVEPTPVGGSAFTFTLPVAQAQDTRG